MSFRINTNTSALSAYNALSKTNATSEKAQLRLATQKRINSASDDTSGYRVGKELQGKISAMKSAQGNVNSAKNLLSTAETALSSINDLLNQIKAKVADSTDPTKNLTSLANDVNALGDEISAIFANTKFNDTQLLSGAANNSFTFKVGVDSTDTLAISLGTIGNLDLSGFSSAGATAANVASVDVATIQTTIQDALGKLGNYQQRLDVKEDYLVSAISNAEATVSRIFDADMATEQLEATKGQIGSQVGTSMLAQLNQAPNAIMGLFR